MDKKKIHQFSFVLYPHSAEKETIPLNLFKLYNNIVYEGVDFQVKTIRVDDRNIAIQLWDTAGYKYGC